MKVSMKVDYGLRAMLVLAQSYGQRVLQSGEIAAQQQIPEPYLEQLLTTLRKAGLLRSRRGPRGGHFLAHPPSQITLDQVVSALEGTSPPVSCMEDPKECPNTPTCPQRELWAAVDEAAQKVLKTTTLAQLAQSQKRRERGGMYSI